MKRRLLQDNAILIGLIGLGIFFTTQSSAFLTLTNLRTIAINSSVLAVLVVAATMLLIAGHLDLSIGSTVGLGGTLASLSITQWGLPPLAAIFVGIGGGAAVGVVNGLLCGLIGFNSIIVTLGMLSVVRGATLLTTSGSQFGLGSTFATLGRGEVLHLPVLVLIGLGTFVVGAIFLNLTPWGRHVYAIGVNPRAAFLAGIRVRAEVFWLYVATGMSAGLAGVLFTARLDGATPGELGTGMEVSALTAILIGGVSFAGGRGALSGVFFAVLLLGALQNGLILMNVSPFIQLVAQGGVLVIAAALDWIGGRLSGEGFRLGRVFARLPGGARQPSRLAVVSATSRHVEPTQPDGE
jgi:ribose/xylose/arabinose/galactoside ABC-type transport system permease subunit